jgi:hypothetical protein
MEGLPKIFELDKQFAFDLLKARLELLSSLGELELFCIDR